MDPPTSATPNSIWHGQVRVRFLSGEVYEMPGSADSLIGSIADAVSEQHGHACRLVFCDEPLRREQKLCDVNISPNDTLLGVAVATSAVSEDIDADAMRSDPSDEARRAMLSPTALDDDLFAAFTDRDAGRLRAVLLRAADPAGETANRFPADYARQLAERLSEEEEAVGAIAATQSSLSKDNVEVEQGPHALGAAVGELEVRVGSLLEAIAVEQLESVVGDASARREALDHEIAALEATVIAEREAARPGAQGGGRGQTSS